jgi:(S)-sulfolactate dehydrogenase
LPDIVISEFMDPAAVAETAAHYDVHYDPDLADKTDDLKRLLADARALVVRNRTRVDADLLEAGPGLQVVGRLGVGLDNIDLAACRDRSVGVCPATGANDDSVAEWVVAAVMTLLRGAFLSADEILNGQWPRPACIGRETAGKTLGLVGFGAIARKTATRAKALGMAVMAYDPYLAAGDPCWELAAPASDLNKLLDAADAVSLHVPLTEETRHLIDAGAIAAMRKGAVLVNSSRGGVVDETALAAALSAGRLAGAALDVYETEPLTREAGRIFAGLKNLLLTPHIAGVTVESNRRVSKVTMDNVRRVLEGASR